MNYKDLIVWQKSVELVVKIYELTKKFPREEIFVLAAQMKRCAISIASNIAEGSRRSSRKDYRHFLLTAFDQAQSLKHN